MPSPRPAVAVSRRGLLLGGAGVLALSGCSDVHLPGNAPSVGPPSPDVLTAGAAAVAITATLALVRRTTAAYPVLGHRLAPLAAVHRAHLKALRDAASSAPTPSATPVIVPRGRPAARKAVETAEGELTRTLTRLAMAAESGELARLLAAMVAALGQRSGSA